MIGNDWDEVLKVIESSEGFKKFLYMINEKYKTSTVYPPKDYVFNALKLTSYKDTKVVIVGQDPYHGEGEAHGLSFSVQKGIKIPPSLQNIYKELYDDLGIAPSEYGDLTKWAQDYIIKALNEKEEPVVFILWGNFAKEKQKYITNPRHLVITSPHPSPFSARYGFFGSKPFSKTNDFLVKNNLKPIDWKL